MIAYMYSEQEALQEEILRLKQAMFRLADVIDRNEAESYQRDEFQLDVIHNAVTCLQPVPDRTWRQKLGRWLAR